MDIEKLIARLENDEQYIDAIDDAISALRKLDAVVEAARKLDREMSAGGRIIAPESALVAAQELVNAIAALDGTNGLS